MLERLSYFIDRTHEEVAKYLVITSDIIKEDNFFGIDFESNKDRIDQSFVDTCGKWCIPFCKALGEINNDTFDWKIHYILLTDCFYAGMGAMYNVVINHSYSVDDFSQELLKEGPLDVDEVLFKKLGIREDIALCDNIRTNLDNWVKLVWGKTCCGSKRQHDEVISASCAMFYMGAFLYSHLFGNMDKNYREEMIKEWVEKLQKDEEEGRSGSRVYKMGIAMLKNSFDYDYKPKKK